MEIMDYQKQRFDHRNALFGFVAFISENILKFVSFRFGSLHCLGSLAGSLSIGFIVAWVLFLSQVHC
jgi:hypothetical protein